jgi:hypothetical protein
MIAPSRARVDIASGPDSFLAEFRDGSPPVGRGRSAFSLVLENRSQFEWLLRADSLSSAKAFINSDFEVRGDLVAAVRFKRWPPGGQARRFWTKALLLGGGGLRSVLAGRRRPAENIQFHYDRPGAFFRMFLDPRMVYSCGYFADPGWILERAQWKKLDLICRKLALKPGEQFLDIGCGWGSLLCHAAENYHVFATGCTLSLNQAEFASRMVESRRLQPRVSVRLQDYRDVTGRYDKIASVGMFEHVGVRRLPGYFRAVYNLLADTGLFPNHGIIRPGHVQPARQGSSTVHQAPGTRARGRMEERNGISVNLATVFFAASLVTAPLYAQQSWSMAGTWYLDVEHSSWGNARKPLHLVVEVEHREPALRYAGSVTYTNEDTRQFAFDGTMDGKEYPVARSFGAGRMTVRRVSPGTIRSVFKSEDGRYVETATTTVSHDGKRLTRRIRVTGPNGETKWTEVYVRH